MTQLQQSFSFAPQPAPAEPSRRNLVIEAGAGTGKTTAIVGEVLKLMLERDDLAPERIVLMTFTEKAAGEIADRIRVALEELAGQLAVGGWRLAGEPPPAEETADSPSSSGSRQPPTANRQLLWPIDSPNPLVAVPDTEKARAAIAHHLANIDSLRSQTIHSFCQSLLRSFPIEAGLDPQFKIIEGFERSLLYGQIYDAWLDEETRLHPTPEIVAEWELLFNEAGYFFMIRDLVLSLSERRDLLAETEYDFGDLDRDVVPKLEEALVWIRRDSFVCKDPEAAAVAEYVRRTPFDGGPLEAWIDYFGPIAENIRSLNLRGCGALKEPMQVLRAGASGRSVYDRLTSHRAAMALLALTRRFLAALDAEKRKLGVVDFDDLLLRTLALLDDEQVLARARTQFDYIFVDEFQDTDRTQARIIDRLAKDAHGAYVPGKTIVVGDPKQSIYGFRRADPETYYRMTEDLARGGAERRVIGEQYRSDPELLDAVNAMFERLFPELPHDPNVFRPAYRALHAARTTSRRQLDARITLLHAQHDDKSDRFFAQAEAIAEWIRANRDGSALDLQRFAILFRRMTELDDYLDTLDRYGIAYVLPPTRLFLDRPAPVDLLGVLRAIAYPFDRGAQISAARSPYFALTDVEIVEGVPRVPRGSSEFLGDLGKPQEPEGPEEPEELRGTRGTRGTWAAFEAAMDRFSEASRHLTVAQLMDLVIETTGIERVYDAAADGARSLRHLEHVRAIAFEYDQRLGGSVRQFVDEISRRRSEPEEMEPSLVDETQNAVRILSVHAAKGLEFDTVILPDLSVQPPQSGIHLFAVEEPKRLVMTGRAVSLSANFREGEGEPLKKISGQREEAETQRLFYVAVTRAKTDVVFVLNPEEKKSVGFHRCLLTSLEGTPLTFPEQGREVHETPIGPVAFEKIAISGDATRQTRRRLHDAALEAELASAPIVPASIPTPVAPPPTANRQPPTQTSRTAGTLLHRVLELWDGRGDYEPLVRALAIETLADAEAVARVRRRLAHVARSETMQRIARAETLGREVTVRVVEDGRLVERRIDRLIRESGHDVVIDYKSGTPDPERQARDREQVTRYCAAIAAITGRPCKGLLWYISVDGERTIEVN